MKMQIPSMQELLEAGVHFGHQTRKWHPKMAQFIFAPKDGVHIIDLEKTVDELGKACKFLAEIATGGGAILFVGTKRQAQDVIKEEAARVGVNWITERWIGGLLTNFEVIHKNIEKLKDLEGKRAADEFSGLTKKERLLIDREIAKLDRLYGGLRTLETVPAAVFIVDVKKEETACREAKRCEIPVVAICDTNANLDLVDYPIPGNDDAIKSVKILVKTVADSILEGAKGTRETEETKEPKAKNKSTANRLQTTAKKKEQPKNKVKTAKKQ